MSENSGGPRPPRVLGKVLSLGDFERLAARRLPRPIYGYVSGACEDGQSLRANREAYADYELTTRCVFLGRPFNYAAAVAGAAGIDHAIALLREELSRNMAMMGVTSPAQFNPSFLVRVPQRGP